MPKDKKYEEFVPDTTNRPTKREKKKAKERESITDEKSKPDNPSRLDGKKDKDDIKQKKSIKNETRRDKKDLEENDELEKSAEQHYDEMLEEERAKYKENITPEFDIIRKEIREDAYGDQEVPKKIDLINHPNMSELKLSFYDLADIENIDNTFMAAQDMGIVNKLLGDLEGELPSHSDMSKKVMDIKQAIDILEYINKQRDTPENMKLSMLQLEEKYSGTKEKKFYTDDIMVDSDHVSDLSKSFGGSVLSNHLLRTNPVYQDQLDEIDRLDDELEDPDMIMKELGLEDFRTSESPRIIEFDHGDKHTLLDLGSGKRKSSKLESGKWVGNPESTMKILSTSDKSYNTDTFDIDGTTIKLGKEGGLKFTPPNKESNMSENGFTKRRNTI